MESTFELTQSVESSKPEILHLEDIRQSKEEESLDGECWRKLLTPNKDLSLSFIRSSLAFSHSQVQNLEELKQSVASLKCKVALGTSPAKLQESLDKLPSQSIEFLRKKTQNYDESVRQSVKGILDLARTGDTEIPQQVEATPEIAFEIFKEMKVQPTVENLIKIIGMLKESDNQKTPKPSGRGADSYQELQQKFRKSQGEVYHLAQILKSYEQRIQLFNELLVETQELMKEMNAQWAKEKLELQKSKQKNPNEEVELLKTALFESEKKFIEAQKQLEQLSKSKFTQSTMTDTDSVIQKLKTENEQLKKQIQENLSTFEQLEATLKHNKVLKKELEQKESQLKSVNNDKQELVEAVEQLAEAAQRILSSSKTKKDKLYQVAEMMSSIRSLNLSSM